MKNWFILFGLCVSMSISKAQIDELSRIQITHNDSSLLVNGIDSSYTFSAYVLTQSLSGITSVTLTCDSLSQDTSWTSVADTVYTWSMVSATAPAGLPFEVWKTTDNILSICLGRLYFNTRYRFTFSIDGPNGLLIKEIVF